MIDTINEQINPLLDPERTSYHRGICVDLELWIHQLLESSSMDAGVQLQDPAGITVWIEWDQEWDTYDICARIGDLEPFSLTQYGDTYTSVSEAYESAHTYVPRALKLMGLWA